MSASMGAHNPIGRSRGNAHNDYGSYVSCFVESLQCRPCVFVVYVLLCGACDRIMVLINGQGATQKREATATESWRMEADLGVDKQKSECVV